MYRFLFNFDVISKLILFSQHEIARLQQQLEEMRHVLDEQPTDESSTEE